MTNSRTTLSFTGTTRGYESDRAETAVKGQRVQANKRPAMPPSIRDLSRKLAAKHRGALKILEQYDRGEISRAEIGESAKKSQ